MTESNKTLSNLPEMNRLIELYEEMAKLTAPECSRCSLPYSCCEAAYCQLAMDWAREHYGVILPETDGKDVRGNPLPLMGLHGCTALPIYRPICTVHTCEINSIGCKKGDAAWTEKYFRLREEIDELEFKKYFKLEKAIKI